MRGTAKLQLWRIATLNFQVTWQVPEEPLLFIQARDCAAAPPPPPGAGFGPFQWIGERFTHEAEWRCGRTAADSEGPAPRSPGDGSPACRDWHRPGLTCVTCRINSKALYTGPGKSQKPSTIAVSVSAVNRSLHSLLRG